MEVILQAARAAIRDAADKIGDRPGRGRIDDAAWLLAMLADGTPRAIAAAVREAAAIR